MPEHKPLYRWSLETANHNDERDLWRESYKENCDCARAIEKIIADNYDGRRLGHNLAEQIIEMRWSSFFVTLTRKSFDITHACILFSNGVIYPLDECGRM